MAWIKVISETKAAGKLEDLYARFVAPSGSVDNILKIHSLNPASLADHYRFYKTLMYGKSPLSRVQREMIAVVVSTANDCHYWMTHHGAGLRKLTKDPELVRALATDYTQAPLSAGDRAMLDYAHKLTVAPSTLERADVERLRDAGFGDNAILDINQVTGYYAFVNRLADGLGVELEDYWADDDKL